jgi:hypothetical protein
MFRCNVAVIYTRFILIAFLSAGPYYLRAATLDFPSALPVDGFVERFPRARHGMTPNRYTVRDQDSIQRRRKEGIETDTLQLLHCCGVTFTDSCHWFDPQLQLLSF